jgi:hypothetical protein
LPRLADFSFANAGYRTPRCLQAGAELGADVLRKGNHGTKVTSCGRRSQRLSNVLSPPVHRYHQSKNGFLVLGVSQVTEGVAPGAGACPDGGGVATVPLPGLRIATQRPIQSVPRGSSGTGSPDPRAWTPFLGSTLQTQNSGHAVYEPWWRMSLALASTRGPSGGMTYPCQRDPLAASQSTRLRAGQALHQRGDEEIRAADQTTPRV